MADIRTHSVCPNCDWAGGIDACRDQYEQWWDCPECGHHVIENAEEF